MACNKDHALVGFVISLWMFLNFALNFFNKWAFTKVEDGGAGFSFPIFYTMWNTLASFLGANLLMILVPANRTISWKQFESPATSGPVPIPKVPQGGDGHHYKEQWHQQQDECGCS